VLVALALMGLGLTAALGLVRLQDQAQAQAEARQEALRLARGLMDQWLQAESLRPGRRQGRESGLAWSVTVRRLQGGEQAPAPEDAGRIRRPPRPRLREAPPLFEVEVCCRRPGSRGVCLASQHVAREGR
jgi:hypothetical protein